MIGNARELRERVPARPAGPDLVHHCGKSEDAGPRSSDSLPAGINLSAGISVVQSKWRIVEADKNNDLPNPPRSSPS